MADAPDVALVRAEWRALLERKLDELPDAFRAVFVLRCVEEMSVEETAQCLGIPETTVRTDVAHFVSGDEEGGALTLRSAEGTGSWMPSLSRFAASRSMRGSRCAPSSPSGK